MSARKRSNRSMTLDNLTLQVEKTSRTTEKDFKLGEQLILAVPFLLLLAPAGSRFDAIFEIKLGDIHIGLHQTRKGPAQLLIESVHGSERGVCVSFRPAVCHILTMIGTPSGFRK